MTAFIFVFITRTFFFEPFSIPAESMQPTLKPNDYVVVYKLGYGNYDFFNFDVLNTQLYSSVSRGDVLVFDNPRFKDTQFIMRLIGLPGDKVESSQGSISINGKVLQTSITGADNGITYLTETIDRSTYAISHIDRLKQKDQGDFSTVVPPRSYFFLGDNRYNSNDSRYWGFVPEQNLVGKLVYTFTSK